MTSLRKLARGQPCQIRVPLVCTGDPTTTVLAHVRLIGVSGMGMKAPDWFGAWACSACHAYCDSNHPNSRQLLLEGMVRTQYELMRRGVVKV
jgi:hypothetical protein